MVDSSASNITPYSSFILVCTAIPVLEEQPGAEGKKKNLAGLVFEGSGIILGQDHR